MTFIKSGRNMTTSIQREESVRSVLNVGGNSKSIEIPDIFSGWRHDLLDIDPVGKPDVLCDARELWTLPPRQYDAVYCSHNLEHYYAHDVSKVLKGFKLILKKDGFVYLRVPDLLSVVTIMVEKRMDVDDILYHAPSGPIRIGDVLYGFQHQIKMSGNDFFAHKTGFTEKKLRNVLSQNGFPFVFAEAHAQFYEIVAVAFIQKPTPWQIELLALDRLNAFSKQNNKAASNG